MLIIIILIIQLIILFLLARSFSKNFFSFWFLITKSKHWAMRISSFFLFPGTLIHELSHWLVAEILQVPTGEIKLIPEFDNKSGIRMGSVKIAKVDPFRRTLIGIAPIITGITILTIIASMINKIQINYSNISNLIIIGYFITVTLISNTMFSSKKDMEASFIPLFFIVIISGTWWYFGWQLPNKLLNVLINTAKNLNQTFLTTIIINIIFLLIVKIFTTIFSKILKRKLVN